MLRTSATRLSFCLVLLLAALSSPPLAEADCQYPLSYTKTYYAWIDDADPNFYSCHYILISPAWKAHWGMIGGEMLYCDGKVETFGDTTSCTGPSNTEITYLYCAPICN